MEDSSTLCLDYIFGNLEQKLKIRPSKTKPCHKMRTRGFEPGVNGIPSTFPTELIREMRPRNHRHTAADRF
ncbi:hypothetical protein OSB04_009958 [Centaurea solstitialis]|uniref:Uncharacterized protein n=1 Tax=Centaurea solstitialis TaxID=347529 RepID=A0AA38T6L4_9ASTR|nr:hypothetical protein OSB04_009958 [Centaurea solstitialis]